MSQRSQRFAAFLYRKNRRITDLLWVAHDLLVLELEQRLKEKDHREEIGDLTYYGDNRIPRPRSQRKNVIDAITEVQSKIEELRPSPVTIKPTGLLKELIKK